MRNTLLCFICLILSTHALSQESAKALGLAVFKVFQAEELSGLDAFIPSPDQATKLASQLGVQSSPEDLETFKARYPAEVKQFKNRCDGFLTKGKNLGIDWKKVRLKKVKTRKESLYVSEAEPNQMIDIDAVDIIFKHQDREFKIVLKGVFELDGRWFLGGDQIAFEEIE